MLYLITKMDEHYQIEIKDYLESKSTFSYHSNADSVTVSQDHSHLYEKIDEL
jgi:hypothetical protein